MTTCFVKPHTKQRACTCLFSQLTPFPCTPAWFAGTTLEHAGTSALHGIDAVYGPFTGTAEHWTASGVTVQTYFKEFLQQPSVVVMGYLFPDGANGTSNPGPTGVIGGGVLSNFPAFRHVGLHSVLSWQGTFVSASDARTLGASGGPTVFYSTAATLIGSPLDHFKTTGEADVLWDGSPAGWVPSTAGTVQSLPPAFRHEFVLFAGRAGEVTDTLYRWGASMQARHRGQRPLLSDATLSKLSYQTDNGAQLCFCTAGCDGKLLTVVESLSAAAVPVGLMSFQGGWWQNPNLHTSRCAPVRSPAWLFLKFANLPYSRTLQFPHLPHPPQHTHGSPPSRPPAHTRTHTKITTQNLSADVTP